MKPPETTPPAPLGRLPPRTFRWLSRLGRWLAVFALTLETLYLLVVNVTLNLPILTKQINDEDIELTWGFAFSPAPGYVIVHGFFMHLQDANIQFSLKIAEAHARFTLRDLTHRTFHITRVDAGRAEYLMRMRRTPEEVAQTDLSFLPLIEGFPAVPLRRTVEPLPGNDWATNIWTVHIEGVHVEVDEGWFEQLRWRGASVATGSFTLRPKQLVIVDGHWHVKSGGFTVGPNHLADGVHGDASVRISPFDPRLTPGNEPLRYLDGLLTLEGRLSSTKFINPLLSHTTAPQLSSDEGALELFFHFDRGYVAPGTHIRIRAPNWEIARGRYLAKSSMATLDSTVEVIGGVPRSLTRFDLGPYEVRRTPKLDDPGGELLTGDGMVLTLSAEQLDTLGPFFSDLAYSFKLHEARMSDLRRLNAYLPHTEIFEVLGGTGTISADYVSPADDNGHGVVDIGAQDAVVRANRIRLGGTFQLHADLTGVASNSERLVIIGQRPLGAVGHAEGTFYVARPGDPFVATPPMGSGVVAADLTIDPFTTEEAKRGGIWPFLSSQVSAKGQFEGLGFINGLLSQSESIKVSGGAGSFSVDGQLNHGHIEPGSRVDVRSKDALLTWSDYRATADALFSAQVSAPTTVSSPTEIPKLEGALKIERPRIEVAGESLFTADEIALSGRTAQADLGQIGHLSPALILRTKKARVPQLRVLNHFLASSPARFEEGSAEIAVEVSSPADGDGKGSLGITVKGIAASYDDLALRGDLDLLAHVGGIGERPWRSGFWDRTRLSSNGELRTELTLRPGSGSAEKGLLRLGIHATEDLSGLPTSETTPTLHDLLQSVVAHATLNGDIDGVGYFNRFLGGSGVRVDGGHGGVNAAVGLAKGAIAAGSWAHVQANGLAVRAGAFALDTKLGVTAVVGPEGPNHLSLGLGLDSYQVRAVEKRSDSQTPLDPILLQGSGLRVEVRSDDLDPSQLLAIASLQATLGDLRVPDLRSLNLILPPSGRALITGGQAQITGTLDKPAHGKGRAVVQIQGTNTGFDLAGHKLAGDWSIKAQARTVSSGPPWGLPKSMDLSGSGFTLSEMSFGPGADVPDGWWAALALPQASLGLGKQPVLVGKLDVKARDVKPFLALYGHKLGIPGILSRYLTFEGLHGGANLLVQPGLVQVTEADLRSNRLRLRGRILAERGEVQGELLLSDPPLNFGIDLHGKGTGFQVWGAEGWYREQLQTPLAEKALER
jgi:hypothetical protein